MNKYATIIAVITAVLLIVGLFAYHFLEIYDRTMYKNPSPEARANEFLALEKWLDATGHPAGTAGYVYDYEELMDRDEDVFVIDALSFSWLADTFDTLKPWIESGKHLVIYYSYWTDTIHDEDFPGFAEKMGVAIISPAAKDKGPGEKEDDAGTDIPGNGGAEAENVEGTERSLLPDFDFSLKFRIPENRKDILWEGKNRENANLVYIPAGKGSVTFTGVPYFMHNPNLKQKEENTLLSWYLTGGNDKDKRGIVFIRESRQKMNTFFADLLDEGNIFPLLISVLLLVAVCFWGFIPRFGKTVADEESPGKPIRERFLAEALFLKKYHSLNMYIDLYGKTIEQRFRKNYGEHISGRELFCSRIAEITRLDVQTVSSALYPRGRVTSRHFKRCMKIIEIILERL